MYVFLLFIFRNRIFWVSCFIPSPRSSLILSLRFHFVIQLKTCLALHSVFFLPLSPFPCSHSSLFPFLRLLSLPFFLSYEPKTFLSLIPHSLISQLQSSSSFLFLYLSFIFLFFLSYKQRSISPLVHFFFLYVLFSPTFRFFRHPVFLFLPHSSLLSSFPVLLS